MNGLVRYLPQVWLGAALAIFADIGITDWEFWAISAPFWILMAFRDDTVIDEARKKGWRS